MQLITIIISYLQVSIIYLTLLEDNRVFAFGSNDFGQLGNEDIKVEQSTPLEIDFFKDKDVKDILTGKNHSFVLTSKIIHFEN